MGKINLLSEELCNRIAAGEVIDRPYSVVKELIENSIDAGATEIEVYIEYGGKDHIKVVDNGCGIEKDDMVKAFYPHATSKICNLEDIDHIHTLGFRGEALATINSVASVELISSTDGVNAYKLKCFGGEIGKVEPAVAPKGTQITVDSLFFNTPVRYKFMRSDKKEENDVTAYVTRFILGHPDVSFKYYVDNKLTLQSYGGGLEEAITKVYGPHFLPNCFKINAQRNNIKISGFISNQNFFKSNKTYQTVFLNGRRVENYVISSAITNAYSAYAMKRQYPFYVLFLEMPDDIVDVNVHPNKADVRFVDNSLIYGTIYKVISTILDGTVKAAEFVVEDNATSSQGAHNPAQPYAAEYKQTENVQDSDFSGVAGIEQFLKKSAQSKQVADSAAPQKQEEQSVTAENQYTQRSITGNIAETTQKNYDDYFEEQLQPTAKGGVSSGENGGAMPEKIDDFLPPSFYKDAKNLSLNEYFGFGNEPDDFDHYSVCSGNVHAMAIEQDRIIAERDRLRAEQQKLIVKKCEYKGALFNTYLLYELDNEVYIIDQHAAHERLLYDGLIKKLGEKQINKQGMMIPFVFAVNPEEQKFIEDNLKIIKNMGFSIELFGVSSYRVTEIPADLPDLNLREFFNEILSNVHELKEISMADILKDKIAQTACKHAVKGGEILTDAERDTLFEMLKGNMGLKCPHGRPICVKMTKTEIEKMFKRKV